MNVPTINGNPLFQERETNLYSVIQHHEKEIGITLPEDFRTFIGKYDPSPWVFNIPLRLKKNGATYQLGLCSGESVISSDIYDINSLIINMRSAKCQDDRWERLLVANNNLPPGGIYLNYSKSDFGMIFSAPNYFPYINDKDWVILAKNFSEFISRLKLFEKFFDENTGEYKYIELKIFDNK